MSTKRRAPPRASSTSSDKPIKQARTNKPANKPTASSFGDAFATLAQAPIVDKPTKSVKFHPAADETPPSSNTKRAVPSHTHTPRLSKDVRKNRELSEASKKFQQAKLKHQKKSQLVPPTVAAATGIDVPNPHLIKLRQQEKALLYEKDHVTPQFDDVEKKLLRIATKGVVTLFNAVREQQKAIEQIQHNSSLLLSEKERLTKQQTHSGFVDLLESSAKGQLSKKLTDMYKDDNDDDEDTVKQEDDDSDVKSEYDNDSDDDDSQENNGNAAPLKPSKRPIKQWAVLGDDYLKQTSHSMKDWEHDSDSDSDSEDIL